MKKRHTLSISIMCAILAMGAAIFAQGMAWQDAMPQDERELKERQHKEGEFKKKERSLGTTDVGSLHSDLPSWLLALASEQEKLFSCNHIGLW